MHGNEKTEVSATSMAVAAKPALVATLAAIDILRTVKPETLDALARIAQPCRFGPADTIINEGELSTELFLIEKGQVEIFRTLGEGSPESHLLVLGPGEPVGEMSLLDGAPRSASARAQTECSLLKIQSEDLLAFPSGEHLLADLKSSLAVAITRRVRKSTDKTIAAMQRELKTRQEQQQFGRFFIYILGVMAIGTLVNNFLANGALNVNIYTEQFAWQYLLVLFVPSAFVMLRMRIPVSEMGITTKGLKRSLIEGAIAGVLLIGLALAAAQILAGYGLVPGKPQPFDLTGAVAYFFHSLLQELVARGFVQTSFQRFLNDQKGFRSILLASILFGLFHLQFGITGVGVTILSSWIFGALYLRHRNLAGVTLLHFLSGVAAFNTGLI